jgi:hypothetical protein
MLMWIHVSAKGVAKARGFIPLTWRLVRCSRMCQHSFGICYISPSTWSEHGVADNGGQCACRLCVASTVGRGCALHCTCHTHGVHTAHI